MTPSQQMVYTVNFSMERGIYVLSRNRSFLSVVSTIASAALQMSTDDGGVKNSCPGNAQDVVKSVLKVLDVADKYEDEELQRLVEPLKHKLKVAVVQLRQLCTTSVMHGALCNSIQLLAHLEEFEEDCTKKLHCSVLLRLQELDEVNKSDAEDDMQLLVEALQCISPLLRHLQARLEVITEKACHYRFHDAAKMSKFYIHLLGDTYRQAEKHANSASLKVMKTFALQLVCSCLTRMLNAICPSQTVDPQVLMGSFVDAMDQVLYLLLEETTVDGTDQLSSLLEALVTHGMSVYQLSAGDIKNKVYAACKEVLEQKAALENMQISALSCECRLRHRKFASILERFEATVNIAVVELIVNNYMGLTLALERLLEAAELLTDREKNSSKDGTEDMSAELKGSVMEFCAAVDQVYNIIQQAVGCSTDEQRVTSLLSEVEALEQLDPELVAGAVALATDTSDQGLRCTMSLLQAAWEFHTKNLFLNLLHLCNPDTFFNALDLCLKHSIARLEQEEAITFTVKKITIIAYSAVHMTRVVFEDVGIPEDLQVSTEHLTVAVNALRNAPKERVLKRAKVVRGCAWQVRNELRNHLPMSSVLADAESSKLSCGEQVADNRGDTQHVLDVTKILNKMSVSVQDSRIGSVSENWMSATFQRKDVSKIFPSLCHRDVSHVSGRPEVSALQNRALASAAQMSNKRRLEHMICISKEAIAHTEIGQWIQNNTAICTLAVSIKHLASELQNEKRSLNVCTVVAQLSQLTARFAEELLIVQSHLEEKTHHAIPAKQLVVLRSDLNCCADKLSVTAATLHESMTGTLAVADIVERVLAVASATMKLVLQVCGQGCTENESLLRNNPNMSRMWVLKLPSCYGTDSSV